MSKYLSTVEVRLGKAIARERSALGLTQEELAQAIGVQQETISRFERGVVLPPLQRLIQLADVFDIPLDGLVRGTTNRASDDGLEITTALKKLTPENREFIRRWVIEMCEQLSHKS
ncbi:helix-turn-helix domain-containing protein [Paraburkholderia tropica]|uniref:helix-turn-helix domain-containing protein n=1 Tax=Paraburkholderia tropica TaxID=92647 RepID=UPI002ABDE1AE|nr:helix-turn-helix transcriptional regulator [Paraburkholderia tropica]